MANFVLRKADVGTISTATRLAASVMAITQCLISAQDGEPVHSNGKSVAPACPPQRLDERVMAITKCRIWALSVNGFTGSAARAEPMCSHGDWIGHSPVDGRSQ